MAANPTENPLKSQKSKTNQKTKRTAAAPFVFLFSIAFYISIVYFFSSSISTLITDIKFWFFISNTLILIIAADYGAFSSSKDVKRDFHEEYSLHNHATRMTLLEKSLSATEQTSDIVEKRIPVEEHEVTETVNEIPEKILEVVKIEQKTIRRSKSEKVKHVNDKRKSILHHSNTEKHKEHDGPSAQHEHEHEHEHEHDEFSAMSDEELNRRVEEFIEKFNRQMRLQV